GDRPDCPASGTGGGGGEGKNPFGLSADRGSCVICATFGGPGKERERPGCMLFSAGDALFEIAAAISAGIIVVGKTAIGRSGDDNDGPLCGDHRVQPSPIEEPFARLLIE